MKSKKKLTRQVRGWCLFFMGALVVSGITASFVEPGLNWMISFMPASGTIGQWLAIVYDAVRDTNSSYPFIAYGFDWLAFGHIVIAAFFIGPYREPVKNKWVIQTGIWACLAILPVAFIAGHYRGIPPLWQLIDCSFGLLGLIPLLSTLNKIQQLEQLSYTTSISQ